MYKIMLVIGRFLFQWPIPLGKKKTGAEFLVIESGIGRRGKREIFAAPENNFIRILKYSKFVLLSFKELFLPADTYNTL
jgi:hypothetical protein